MNIFAVIGVDNPEQMENFIESEFPDNFLNINDNEWFVASGKTTQQLTDVFSEKLTSGNENTDLFIIAHITNWNGWYATNAWEWLALKTKESSNEE